MSIGDHKPPLALIAGATASGKSALALRLAERIGGVIINGDSAQLYRDLPVLSATPTPKERARADHRLYGVRDGALPCSAAEWAKMARTEIAEAHSAERLPILVGWTGLYIRTLIEGLAPVPPVDPAVRSAVRSASVAENRAKLAELDPEAAARLEPRDTARTARALEVVLSTGRPLAAWQESREGGIAAEVTLQPLILLPPRSWLYERCDRRFEEMVDRGAIDEVEGLLARRLDPSLPVMRAIGVREIAAFLSGAIGRDEMVARGQQATRNYAKRQHTWFAHQPPSGWPRLTEALDDESNRRQALALFGQPL